MGAVRKYRVYNCISQHQSCFFSHLIHLMFFFFQTAAKRANLNKAMTDVYLPALKKAALVKRAEKGWSDEQMIDKFNW